MSEPDLQEEPLDALPPARQCGLRELTAFVLANLILKFALIPLNRGEYTDGILQLTVFSGPGRASGLYPPLYGALAALISGGGRLFDLLIAGKILSAIASSLALIPIWLTAHRLGSRTAARWAGVFFTLSPMVLRWSIHAMTDALFFALSAASLHFALSAWVISREFSRSLEIAFRSGLDGNAIKFNSRAPSRADSALSLALLFAALSVLTRYQGALLLVVLTLPAISYALAFSRYEPRHLPWRSVAAVLLFALVPIWMRFAGFAHASQFTTRTSVDSASTALAYWNLAESFVLISPYYFGYPIAAFAVTEVLGDALASPVSSATTRRTLHTRLIALYALWSVILLTLQSLFQSFQYRYMLPLAPGIIILAGLGAARLDAIAHTSSLRRTLLSAATILSLAYLTIFSCAILVLQRDVYTDQRDAAEYVRAKASPSTKVFSNERYGERYDLGSVKLSWWAKRAIQSLYIPSSDSQVGITLQPLSSGDILIISNAYGGNQTVLHLMEFLQSKYTLQPLTQSFVSRLWPILDDIMVDPTFNQNPLAWVLRYQPQDFFTRVFIVQENRTRSNENNANP